MLNKALRILIADEQHFHRMQMERSLNYLGYFRIAPVHSVQELLTLVEYGGEPFDLVLVSATLSVDFDPLALCADNPQVRHACIYHDRHGRFAQVGSLLRSRVQVSSARRPELEALQSLMRLVDPAAFVEQWPDAAIPRRTASR